MRAGDGQWLYIITTDDSTHCCMIAGTEQSRAEHQRRRMGKSPVQSPSPRREAKQNEGEAGSLDCTCVCVLACLLGLQLAHRLPWPA